MATAARQKPLEEFSQNLAGFNDVEQLLRHAARRAREVLDGEECAVSLRDRQTTHLTAALATRSGHVGVIEVVGLRRGDFTTTERPLLEVLAAELAVACEHTLECEERVGGVFALGRDGLAVGLALAAVGLLFVLGAVFVHQGLALPLSELPARPGMRPGLALLLVGGLLVLMCRGVGRRSSAVRKPEPAAPAVREGANPHVDG